MSETAQSRNGRSEAKKAPAKKSEPRKHHLIVLYDGNTLVDQDVERFGFTTTEDGVRIEAGDAVGGDQGGKAKVAIDQLVNAVTQARAQRDAMRQQQMEGVGNGHITG